jgi:hypothetical protein
MKQAGRLGLMAGLPWELGAERDYVRLAARVFFGVGCVAFQAGQAQSIEVLRPILAPAVPRQIAAVPPISWTAAISFLLVPVGPFAAWAILTVLCDIRDGLLGEEADA